ncbi:MAG: hypothetical protein ABIU63_17320 [Chitinophagaceae bacterium]
MSFAAPGDPIPRIRQTLATYYRNYPQEKVYLQLDKQFYSAAETIWFSGYVIYKNTPSFISNILYVELFNDKGRILNRAMLPVQKGTVSGEFLLPASLPAGNYYIRAYTAWMLNFSNELFFYRKISVTDNRKPEKKQAAAGHADFSVQFFPEGGNLVSRLTSLVAFKAIDTNGLPVNASGKVFNNLGDTMALIKTTHKGTGYFIIHCTPQTIYTALVTANGITKKIPLPAVQTNGIVLHTETHITAGADSVFFHISRSGLNKEKFENLLLCARMENNFSVSKIHFNETTFNDPLDTVLTAPYPLLLNDFGAGLLHIAVLTESGNVLAERTVFLRQQRPDSVQLQLAATNTSEEKSNFLVSLPNDYKGTLAISVTDAGDGTDDGSGNSIRAAMLLSPEITASIDDAEWYFDSRHPEAAHALDVLLLTCSTAGSGLQRILDRDEQKVKYFPEKAITLSGRAFEIRGNVKSPMDNGSLFLILKNAADSITLPLRINTDTTGFFVVNDLAFHDTASIYIQTGTKTPGSISNSSAIEFSKNIFDSIAQSNYSVAPTVLSRKPVITNADSPVDASSADQAGILANVTVTAKTRTQLDSVLAQYASGMFANPGSWAQTLDLTRDPITANSDQDVLAWLNGKAAGLNYSYSNGKPVIYWRFSNIIVGLSNVEQLKLNSPAFFLNEALLSAGLEGYDAAIDLLSGIRIADVALIRIYKPGTMPNVPDNGPHGTIAIWLKNGAEVKRPVPGVDFAKFSIRGYKINRRFVDIDTTLKKHSTLYWNPSLEINPLTHTASFSFAKNGSKLFRIIAQGMDGNGNVVSVNQLVNNNSK